MKQTSWQQRAAAFARDHDLYHDPLTHALDLVSEVGEVAKEILRATDYGRQTFEAGPELAAELGDALYSLLVLTAVCQVDAEQALTESLTKYKGRLKQTGSAGSG